MRPARRTPAHATGLLAELVCSNSLKSENPGSPTGALKQDLAALGSLVIQKALENRVPAGKALAVDREGMGRAVTEAIESEPSISLIREEITRIPEGYDHVIIATGPLTSEAMTTSLEQVIGEGGLYFYDAIAPTVDTESVDMSIAFRQDRYGEPGGGDYLNLPMNRDEYEQLVDALLAADKVAPREFEKEKFFEGCLPVEEIAARGRESLAFGPLRPVGLTDPRTGRRPHACVQLRRENADGSAMGLVGFQTKLKYGEQQRVFRIIPGLERAQFVRFGSIHRNTYINSPRALGADMTLINAPDVRLAGQITGVEGYVESIATGLLAGLFTAGDLTGAAVAPPPPETTLGALLGYITDRERAEKFQPSNINFSLFPPPEQKIRKKALRREHVIRRAAAAFAPWAAGLPGAVKT